MVGGLPHQQPGGGESELCVKHLCMCLWYVCALCYAGLQLEHQPLRSLNPVQDGALIYRADLQSTLHEVVLYGFLQPNAAGYMHVSA